MKKSNLNKLVVLAVLATGVSYSSNALADDRKPTVKSSQNTVTVDGTTCTIVGEATQSCSDGDTIYGGYTDAGSAGTTAGTGNTVTIQKTSAETPNISRVYGGCGNTSANYNVVKILSSYTNTIGDSDYAIFGGESAGVANYNNVIIAGGVIKGDIVAGDGSNGANGNIVRISDGTDADAPVSIDFTFENIYIRGGKASNFGGNTNSNTIIYNNTKTSLTYVPSLYGGRSDEGSAIENVVTVKNGYLDEIIGGYVYGAADGGEGHSIKNTVNIVGYDGYTGDISGGLKEDHNGFECTDLKETHIYENKVNIGFGGGTVNIEVKRADHGGIIGGGSAVKNSVIYKNEVNIGDGTVSINNDISNPTDPSEYMRFQGIFGGASFSNSSTENGGANNRLINNTINITGGTIKKADTSPYPNEAAFMGIYGAGAMDISQGEMNNNSVNIKGGNINLVIDSGMASYGVSAGIIGGGTLLGKVTNNNVNISGGNTNVYQIFGGYTIAYVDMGGSYLGFSADGNQVVISGDNSASVQTTAGQIIGGQGSSGANYNKVIVKENVDTDNVSVTGITDARGEQTSVIGGYAPYGTIEASTFSSGANPLVAHTDYNEVHIAKGQYESDVIGGYASSPAGGNADNNIVEINGGEYGGNIYGGYSVAGNAQNNTVIINGGEFSVASELHGGYAASTDGKSSNNILVIGAKDISVGKVADFQVYRFNVANISKGDTMLKIRGTDPLDVGGSTVNVLTEGTNLEKDEVITLIEMTDKTADTAIIKNCAAAIRQTDGIADTEGLIYGDEEKAAGEYKKLMFKMKEKKLNPDGSKAPVEGMAAAANSVNTSSDLATGVGMNSLISSTAGITGTETFGAANFGKARYETGSHVDVNGYSLMVGIGRKVFDKAGNKTTGGLFFEYGNSNFDTYNNSVTGSGKNVYKGGGYLMRFDNTCGNYYEGMIHAGKISTNWSNSSGGYGMSPVYYGGAVTYGHKFMFDSKKQLSVYGTYIYSHTGGGDATINKYTYDFEATKSHRTKLGVRYTLTDLMDTTKFRPYIGLAWEHEFNGETRASVVGFKDGPAAPSMKGDSGIIELGFNQEVGKWTLGLGAELFSGKKRGWNGTLKATYNF